MNRIRVDFPHYLNFFISWKTKPRPLKLSVGYLLKTPVLLVNLLRLTQFSLGCNIPSPQMQLVAKFPLVCIATKAIIQYLNATSFLIYPSMKDGMLLLNNLFVEDVLTLFSQVTTTIATCHVNVVKKTIMIYYIKSFLETIKT